MAIPQLQAPRSTSADQIATEFRFAFATDHSLATRHGLRPSKGFWQVGALAPAIDGNHEGSFRVYVTMGKSLRVAALAAEAPVLRSHTDF